MPEIRVDLAKLKATLLTSGLQTRDNPLFQVINSLITASQQIQALANSNINSSDTRIGLSSLVIASQASILLGRGSLFGPGDFQEITLGPGLMMTGTVLDISGIGIHDDPYAPLTFGTEPLSFVSNGSGAVIMVAFTP